MDFVYLITIKINGVTTSNLRPAKTAQTISLIFGMNVGKNRTKQMAIPNFPGKFVFLKKWTFTINEPYKCTLCVGGSNHGSLFIMESLGIFEFIIQCFSLQELDILCDDSN